MRHITTRRKSLVYIVYVAAAVSILSAGLSRIDWSSILRADVFKSHRIASEAGQQSYISVKYNYEVSYPRAWVLLDSRTASSLETSYGRFPNGEVVLANHSLDVFQDAPKDYLAVYISVYDDRQQTLDEFSRAQFTYDRIDQIEINGFESRRIYLAGSHDKTEQSSTMQNVKIIVHNGNRFVVFTHFNHSQESQDIMEAIAGSFQSLIASP